MFESVLMCEFVLFLNCRSLRGLRSDFYVVLDFVVNTEFFNMS